MNRHERISAALHGYAEMRVPETVDPWPDIRESLSGDAVAARPGRLRRFRPVPRTRKQVILTLILVALFTMGAYAGSKWVFQTFQDELPGGNARELGTQLYLTQTMDGAKVNVEWAYADEQRVVVGYSVEDLKEDRKDYENDAELEPILASGPKDALPPHIVDITDASGDDFKVVGGTVYIDDEGTWMGPLANTAVFAAPDGLEPGEIHRFHFEVTLDESPVFPPGATSVRDEPDPIIGPFTFDFEIPVRTVGVVEMNQTAEANGLTMTLDRVVQSPGRPQAIVCFDPPNDNYLWRPSMAPTGYQVDEPLPVHKLKDGCWSLAMKDPAEGRQL